MSIIKISRGEVVDGNYVTSEGFNMFGNPEKHGKGSEAGVLPTEPVVPEEPDEPEYEQWWPDGYGEFMNDPWWRDFEEDEYESDDTVVSRAIKSNNVMSPLRYTVDSFEELEGYVQPEKRPDGSPYDAFKHRTIDIVITGDSFVEYRYKSSYPSPDNPDWTPNTWEGGTDGKLSEWRYLNHEGGTYYVDLRIMHKGDYVELRRWNDEGNFGSAVVNISPGTTWEELLQVKTKCSGNLHSLVKMSTTAPAGAFRGLFAGHPLISAPLLGAKVIGKNAYTDLFRMATYLKYPPTIYAETIGIEGCSCMLAYSGITMPPKIKAKELSKSALNTLCRDCVKINTTYDNEVIIPATMVWDYSLGSIFQGCTNMKGSVIINKVPFFVEGTFAHAFEGTALSCIDISGFDTHGHSEAQWSRAFDYWLDNTTANALNKGKIIVHENVALEGTIPHPDTWELVHK